MKGLAALWREGLLAQAVLRGQTKGYRNHPQLARFREHPHPLNAINAYLWHVYREAQARGYAFDARKVRRPGAVPRIGVNRGQVAYEMEHLLNKLKRRDTQRWGSVSLLKAVRLHPAMVMRSGEIEVWEKVE